MIAKLTIILIFIAIVLIVGTAAISHTCDLLVLYRRRQIDEKFREYLALDCQRMDLYDELFDGEISLPRHVEISRELESLNLQIEETGVEM